MPARLIFCPINTLFLVFLFTCALSSRIKFYNYSELPVIEQVSYVNATKVLSELSLRRHIVDPSDLLHRLPETPLTQLRVLHVINNFDLKQFNSLKVVLRASAKLCEFGWDVKVILQTAVGYSRGVQEQIHSALFCSRLRAPMNLTIQKFAPSIKHHLAVKHREVFGQELPNFDLFIYAEDDMVVQLRHCVTFLWELTCLNETYVPGFMRYQVVRDEFKTMPYEFSGTFQLLRFHDRWYFPHKVNPHQGFTLLTQSQLQYLQARCGYVHPPRLPSVRLREFMSSLQLFLPVEVGGCGLRKVLPVTDFAYLLNFAVLHYSTTWLRKSRSAPSLKEFSARARECVRQSQTSSSTSSSTSSLKQKQPKQKPKSPYVSSLWKKTAGISISTPSVVAAAKTSLLGCENFAFHSFHRRQRGSSGSSSSP